jgi:hypothetical protein
VGFDPNAFLVSALTGGVGFVAFACGKKVSRASRRWSRA